jgi:hypothetical protein
MSYILDAIKKAESERGNTRLVENNHVDSSQHTAKPVPWVAIAILINAAILLTWIGWQYFSGTRHNENVSETQHFEDDLNQQKKEIISPLPTIVLENKPQIVEQPNKESSSNELPIEKNNTKPNFITNSDKVEIIKNKVAVVKERVPAPILIIPAQVESLPPVVDNLLPDQQQGSLFVKESEKIELPMEVNVVREVPVIENPNVPSINELPYDLQQRIPELAISVHIYNAVKEARKVRVNGELLYQGDALNDDLSIQEITSYGVIFNYAGELFKVNLH